MSCPTAPFMTAPQKRMRYFSLKALLLTACSLGFAFSSFADNPYWKEFGEQPVYIQQIRARSEQTLKFIGFENEMLIAEVNVDGRIGEMSMPVSETLANALRFDLKEMEEAKQMIRKENFSAATTLLRPKVYPLIKFHQVPEILSQLHSSIRTLLDSLISQGELAEADDLIQRLALDQVDVKYSEIAIRLMQAHLNDKNYKAAARIAQFVPKHSEYSVNISPIITAADELRGNGEYDAVIPLYREIVDIVPDAVRKNILMWLAYSLVLADRVSEATPIIDSMEEPAATHRTFSLYKLLQGSRDHRSENYRNALDVLTRGFVRAQTSYVWVPEMLFLIGDCYAHTEDRKAARNVWSEITILYPESPWATRAADSMTKLPAAKLLEMDQ